MKLTLSDVKMFLRVDSSDEDEAVIIPIIATAKQLVKDVARAEEDFFDADDVAEEVKEFKHIPGVNDAEYIKKLEELHEIDKGIISKAVAKIKMLSAQPERKTGRWIPCPQNVSWLYVYKCSECGGYLQISDVDGIGITAKYCSYCGAKMEGGEQE